jgi:Dynein heavy chain C-terminal domain
VLEALTLRYLDEIGYKDTEVSLVVRDRGIVINGKKKENLMGIIRNLKINLFEESGVNRSSVEDSEAIQAEKSI